jgi:hypothetical protein
MLASGASEADKNVIRNIVAFGFRERPNRSTHSFVCNINKSKCNLFDAQLLLILLVDFGSEFFEGFPGALTKTTI